MSCAGIHGGGGGRWGGGGWRSQPFGSLLGSHSFSHDPAYAHSLTFNLLSGASWLPMKPTPSKFYMDCVLPKCISFLLEGSPNPLLLQELPKQIWL